MSNTQWRFQQASNVCSSTESVQFPEGDIQITVKVVKMNILVLHLKSLWCFRVGVHNFKSKRQNNCICSFVK